MSRRDQITTTDPDVEESRAELEHLEGKKNIIQNEALAIAENKKEVEEERNATITRLDAQVVAKRAEINAAIENHKSIISTLAREQEEAKRNRDRAISDHSNAVKNLELVNAEVSGLALTKNDHLISIDTLVKQKDQLSSSVNLLKIQEDSLKNEFDTLLKSVNNTKGILANLTSKYEDLKVRFGKDIDEHEALRSTKVAKEAEIEKLSRLQDTKLSEIAGLETIIGELHKKRTEHDLHINEQDSKSNERLKNATHLEERVDAKLAQLKEAEKEFTVEHLARIGYKPIGT